MRALFYVFLCVIVSSQNTQTITLNSAWTIGDIGCDNNNNSTECIINCNGDHSCGHDTAGPNIKCLENGSKCIITCNASSSCKKSTIHTFSTSIVNIIFFGDYAGMSSIIYAPINGALTLTASGGYQTFKYGIIHSQQTKTMDIICDGLDDISSLDDTFKEECRTVYIYGADVTDYLNISCINNGQCENSRVWCPTSSTSHDNKCNIYCSYGTANGVNAWMCAEMHVYVNDGLPYDVNWYCDNQQPVVCVDSYLHCKGETQICDWQYNANNWECVGYCFQPPTTPPTSAPTVQPITVSPTIHPSDPTHVPTYYPTYDPTYNPTYYPTYHPTHHPTSYPTYFPTYYPTHYPIHDPTTIPSEVVRTSTEIHRAELTSNETSVENGKGGWDELIPIFMIVIGVLFVLMILLCILVVYIKVCVRKKNIETAMISIEMNKVQSISFENDQLQENVLDMKGDNTLENENEVQTDDSVEKMFDNEHITESPGDMKDNNTQNHDEELYENEDDDLYQTNAVTTSGGTTI